MPTEEVHDAIMAKVESLDTSQRDRDNLFDNYLRMYSRRVAERYRGNRGTYLLDEEDIQWNVIKSVIESLVAMIATHRVRPFFQTFGGNYELKKKAELLNKFVHGQFTRKKVYRVKTDAFKDACIFGSSGVHVYESGNGVDDIDIEYERVYPGEVIIDDEESRDGTPRAMMRHKVINKSELQAMLDMYDIKEFTAEECTLKRESLHRAYIDDNQHVSVVEAWHLKSGPDAEDGRWCLVCSKGVIFDQDWNRPSFPIKFFHYDSPPRGFWGIGVTENLLGIQKEINYILRKIQKLMTLLTTMFWVQKGTGVSKISNADAAIREYSGRPPIHMAPPPVSAEYFQHLDRLRASAYESEGVSQLQASGLKPQGLNSGTAQRQYMQTVSSRFRHKQQEFENFSLEIAEATLDVAREVAERGDAEIRVLCQGDKHCEEISFAECNLDKDKYVLRVYPTGYLPEEPAARTEKLMEMIQIDPKVQRFALKALSGVPDVEAIIGPLTAPYDIVDKHITKMLMKGEDVEPLPFQDLETTMLMITNAILEAEEDGTPDEKIEKLRNYSVLVENMIAQAQPPPPPAPGPDPMGGMPGAMPPPVPPMGVPQ